MKIFISIAILLSITACAEQKKEYLSEYDARVHLNNGGTLFCEDTTTKKTVIVDRRRRGYRIGGMSFYEKGTQVMSVFKCTLER